MGETPENSRPLAQVEDLAELMDRYRGFDDRTLARWMEVVTGPHREAMGRILAERRAKRTP